MANELTSAELRSITDRALQQKQEREDAQKRKDADVRVEEEKRAFQETITRPNAHAPICAERGECSLIIAALYPKKDFHAHNLQLPQLEERETSKEMSFDPQWLCGAANRTFEHLRSKGSRITFAYTTASVAVRELLFRHNMVLQRHTERWDSEIFWQPNESWIAMIMHW